MAVEISSVIITQPGENKFEYVRGPVTIRNMTEEDSEFVAQMIVEGFRSKIEWAVGKDRIPRYIQCQAADFKNQSELCYSQIYVALYEGQPAGMCFFKTNGKDYYKPNNGSWTGLGCGMCGMMCMLMAVEEPKKNACLVEVISVDSNYRGKGIGKVLMDAVEEQARNENCDYMYLEVLPHNPAKHLYERQGFQVTQLKSSVRYWCAIGERRIDIMTKPLK